MTILLLYRRKLSKVSVVSLSRLLSIMYKKNKLDALYLAGSLSVSSQQLAAQTLADIALTTQAAFLI